jgi:hypothetical protein
VTQRITSAIASAIRLRRVPLTKLLILLVVQLVLHLRLSQRHVMHVMQQIPSVFSSVTLLWQPVLTEHLTPLVVANVLHLLLSHIRATHVMVFRALLQVTQLHDALLVNSLRILVAVLVLRLLLLSRIRATSAILLDTPAT